MKPEVTRLKGFFSPLALCKGCEDIKIAPFYSYCNQIQFGTICQVLSTLVQSVTISTETCECRLLISLCSKVICHSNQCSQVNSHRPVKSLPFTSLCAVIKNRLQRVQLGPWVGWGNIKKDNV